MRGVHLILAAGLAVAAGPTAGSARAGETVIYPFAGTPDGIEPEAGLIADAKGALYGTTQSGGASGFGTVFRLTPPTTASAPWRSVVLYSFQGGADGQTPFETLLRDASGALYGTTRQGGIHSFGTVFKLTPPPAGQTTWGLVTLWAFTGGGDGGYPYATDALVIDGAGALYGTTLRGGSAKNGVAFRLSPPAIAGQPWSEAVLHSFRGGKDGYFPEAGLLPGPGGVLYGTTYGGGASFHCSGGCGTLYQLTPPQAGATKWTKTTLHAFQAGSDGESPQSGLTADANGALYGTTSAGGGSKNCSFGCGTAFRLSPPAAGTTHWTVTTLHAFQSGSADTEFPETALTPDASGNLLGTAFGASPNRLGAVFELTPPVAGATKWTETILHDFTGGADGSNPVGGLLAGAGGVFYGATESGGGGGAGICGEGCGAVFKLKP